MAKRKRAPRLSLEDRLEALGALRGDPDSGVTLKTLREHLGLKQNMLVAKTARLAAEFGHTALVGEMQDAFERFLERPVETDSQCIAKNGIATALLELESPTPDLFRRGMRHIQMEPTWGGQVDTAIELRSNCVLGFAQTGGATLEILPLLLDPGLPVRLAAAQALGATATPAAEASLRLKALHGDPEPEVITQCCLELLRLSPRSSLLFVDDLLTHADASRRAALALALGESRLEEGVERLREMLAEAFDPEQRRAILLALVTSRRDEAPRAQGPYRSHVLLIASAGGSKRAARRLYLGGESFRENRLGRALLGAFSCSFAPQGPPEGRRRLISSLHFSAITTAWREKERKEKAQRPPGDKRGFIYKKQKMEDDTPRIHDKGGLRPRRSNCISSAWVFSSFSRASCAVSRIHAALSPDPARKKV